MPAEISALPADPTSTAALAGRGLRMSAIDATDDAAVRAWVEADARGFHDGAPTDEFLAELRDDFVLQRTIGVFDDTLADPAIPIATVAGWPAPVTLPGGEVDAWAVHPGGRSILDRVESALSLDATALAPSREVLRQHGNMSSATLLFILRDLLADAERVEGDRVAALAFGPGLTVEAARLTMRRTGA